MEKQKQIKPCYDWVMLFDETNPIVVGGLGGSGTRVVANILQEAGVYMGDCLNGPLDNLWFTFLFRRPASVRSFDRNLESYIDVFDKRMHGQSKWSNAENSLLRKCAFEFAVKDYVRSDRFGFPWRVLRSFSKEYPEHNSKHWGWKEPNSHIFLPTLIKRYANLRYIHVMRHPLDMVFNKNKLQLNNWKHLFDIDTRDEQVASLQYYQAAQRRVLNIGRQLGSDKFLVVKYEELCHQPVESINRLIEFCSLDINDSTKQRVYTIPSLDKATTNYSNNDYNGLMPMASELALEFGYDVQ